MNLFDNALRSIRSVQAGMNSNMPAVFEECPMGWEDLVVLHLAHHAEAAAQVAAVEAAAQVDTTANHVP